MVIDNSAAFRYEADVPLVVPEVNIEDAKNNKGIIANPNCSTIQMVTALYPLHKVNPIKRIIVSTYQAVSGTGTAAMEVLTAQSQSVLAGEAVTPHVYPHQIAFNLIPEIDVFFDYRLHQGRMEDDGGNAQDHACCPTLPLSATCVRVPVFIGHSEAVNIEFERPISADDARGILAKAPGVRVLDDPTVSLYPHPWMAAGTDDTYVGRIRYDSSLPGGLMMWIVADNVRKGAALNAVQIAEEMLPARLAAYTRLNTTNGKYYQ